MRWWLLSSFLILASYVTLAQTKTTLHCIVADKEASVWKKNRYETQHPDSASAVKEVKRVVDLLRTQTYLAASADQMVYRNDSLLVWFYVGEPFKFNLSKGNAPEDLLSELGYKPKDGVNPLYSHQQWLKLSNRMLAYAENRGYPFASVRLDSMRQKHGQWQAGIHYQSGPIILFDSLLLSGSAKAKAKFLAIYLNILPRQPFSQEKLLQVDKLLAQLPYLKLIQPSSVLFFEEKAYVKIAANQRKTNQFDGIIGFLPNQEAPKQLLITGDVKLKLSNLFGMGRSIQLQWQQVRPASPVLYLEYTHPILFRTRLELKTNFDLLKQDTSFLNVNRRLMLAYPLGKGGKINASIGLRTSRLSNGAQYQGNTQLPASSDVSYLSYGLGYEWSTLDDYFYPKQGFRLNIQGEAGNKKILKNPFVDQQLYEALELNALQMSIRLLAQQYLSLSKKSVLLLKLQAANLASNNLFYNDLYRLGGLNSVRGFNENSFYASTYAVGTIEYHFFTEENAYLLLCYDQAWISTQTIQGNTRDTPLGFGAGINFSTKAGAFNLIYSLGKATNQIFGLNYSKIHFGFVSIF
ncbi:MAG: BamA/TamA family outer membrane protein [Bacteroidota bacterium]